MASEHITAEGQFSAPGGRQTFAFGKRVFVSGLFWQPLPGSTARQRKAEMQKMAEEQGFDLAVQRTSGVPQAGFASVADGVKPGMLSVAAMVSKSLEVANRDRSFLCAMQVPDGQWLYVAQREGVLLHDGDLLGKEEAIRARMMTDLSLTEWQTVFAPPRWGVPDSIERNFEELLPKSGTKYSFKSWWEIRPIRKSGLDFFQDNSKLYAILILAAIVLGGYYAYEQWRIKQEMEELARQEAAEQAIREAAAAERPWKKQPRATKFVANCNAAIGQVKTFWPGNWEPVDAVCNGQSLTVSWTRMEGGWLEHLLALEPKAEFSTDGNKATLNVRMEMSPGEADPLPKERDRIVAMFGAAQRYGLTFALKPMDAAPVLGQPAPAPGTWKTLGWTITGTQLAPSTVVSALEADGFRITQIKLGFGEGLMKWTMEGMQYVQP